MENKYLYGENVPMSKVAYYGVTYGGKSGWEEPDGAKYSSVRQVITGSAALIGYGGKHTWDDWEAYWTDVAIGAPDVETYTLDIPGRMGLVDLSEVLTGAPVYKNREVDVTLTYPGSGEQWHEEYSDILEELHGQTQQLIMDSDPGYYYDGRGAVSSEKTDGATATFTIATNCDPFKYEVNDSLGDWLWDPFSFVDGVIREYGHLYISATSSGESFDFTIVGCDYDVPAVIKASYDVGAWSIKLDGEEILAYGGTELGAGFSFTLPAGTHTITIVAHSAGAWATFSIYFRARRL